MLIKRLAIFSLLFALSVVMLGAYTRLKDAGLGCPDWPGCYGHLVVPRGEAAEIAQQRFPEIELVGYKAWAEMVHRYFAAILGLLITVIFGLALAQWRRSKGTFPWLEGLLFVIVVAQGTLGALTVTMGLFPTIVMAHLAGGFTTLCLIFLLVLRQHGRLSTGIAQPVLVRFGFFAMAILAIQILLGGWTAANYAARVCSDLPICFSGWQQHLNLGDAFQLWGHGLENYEFGTHLDPSAKITIHAFHRIGAIVTTLILGVFLAMVMGSRVLLLRQLAMVASAVLLLQVGLGVSNVVFDLPLLVAVAHNCVAAILMMCLISIVHYSSRAGVKAHV
jgi:cytochrome c oxidase assembly protein subunit 15